MICRLFPFYPSLQTRADNTEGSKHYKCWAKVNAPVVSGGLSMPEIILDVLAPCKVPTDAVVCLCS